MSREEYQRRVEERRERLRNHLQTVLEGRSTITFEAGSGHGHWLTDYAKDHPDRYCLGIDMIRERVERANRKKERAQLDNLIFVRAEAYDTVELLPSGIRFDQIFLLFLDPWPKKRHWKNRLFCQRFLEAVAERSVEGARLHFRTDHAGYFSWAEEVAADQSIWKVDPAAQWPFERETVFQSKAESYQSLILVKQ